MSDKTLDQLKTILDGKTFKAFTTRINEVIDRKVASRVSVIEEQKAEELKTFKNKIQRKAEAYTRKHTLELETSFNRVLEESKKQNKAEMTQALLLLESKLVSHLDQVLEESVNTNTPLEILEEASKARHFGKVAQAVATVIEEQNISIDNSGMKRIQELEQALSQVNGKLLEEQTVRVSAETKANTLQRELLLESKLSGLDATDRKVIVNQFQSASYDQINDSIDKSIELLQESRKQVRRGRVAQNETLVGDTAPTASFSGGKTLIEEEVNRNHRAPAQAQAPQVATNPMFDSIDHLLP